MQVPWAGARPRGKRGVGGAQPVEFLMRAAAPPAAGTTFYARYRCGGSSHRWWLVRACAVGRAGGGAGRVAARAVGTGWQRRHGGRRCCVDVGGGGGATPGVCVCVCAVRSRCATWPSVRRVRLHHDPPFPVTSIFCISPAHTLTRAPVADVSARCAVRGPSRSRASRSWRTGTRSSCPSLPSRSSLASACSTP